MNRVMRKPVFIFFAYAKMKVHISYMVTKQLISSFNFTT